MFITVAPGQVTVTVSLTDCHCVGVCVCVSVCVCAHTHIVLLVGIEGRSEHHEHRSLLTKNSMLCGQQLGSIMSEVVSERERA
jgi:hypothetical protein